METNRNQATPITNSITQTSVHMRSQLIQTQHNHKQATFKHQITTITEKKESFKQKQKTNSATPNL